MKTVIFVLALGLAAVGCAKTSVDSTCSVPITGTSWVPNVAGISAANHDATVVTTKTVLTGYSGPIVGLSDPAPLASEITVSIDMTTDLGVNGSLTLVGETTNFPANLVGSAYPQLVSLVDSNAKEWINLTRAGSGGDCVQSGYYACSGGFCSSNSSCKLNQPSAFGDRKFWDQHQLASAGTTSVTFPSCNWAGGNAPPNNNPSCAFNSDFFVAGKLPVGTYTAKYLLLASNYSSVPGGRIAGLKVTVVKKKDATVAVGGAVDVNVVLVGSANVNSSRTAKGQQNLNLLFGAVHNILSQANSSVKLGVITVYEWPCDQGGDVYSTISASKLGALFQDGSTRMVASGEGKSLNIFITTTIQNDDPTGLPILGESGAISGPPINGTPISGLAFGSSGQIDTFNPNCTASSCPLTSQQPAFVDMGATIAHEMGHYLGLNHPSENVNSSGVNTHDSVLDTPICTKYIISSGTKYMSISACITDTNAYQGSGGNCNALCTPYNSLTGIFCPAVVECGFNHLMWWSSKNFFQSTGAGDGNILTTQSGQLINYSPFVQ